MAFSSHVLEHTPDPARPIRDQLGVLKDDGVLIALFPNGSDPFRAAEPHAFHRLWGRVHPVMLNDQFVTANLGDQVVFRGSLSESDLNMLQSIS